MGVFMAFYVSSKTGNWLLGVANFICVLLLVFYSISFKKKLLIGNVLISILTAWVILVLYIGELRVKVWNWTPEFKAAYTQKMAQLFKLAGYLCWVCIYYFAHKRK